MSALGIHQRLDGILKCRGLREWLFITLGTLRLRNFPTTKTNDVIKSCLADYELGLTAYAGGVCPTKQTGNLRKVCWCLVSIPTSLAICVHNMAKTPL